MRSSPTGRPTRSSVLTVMKTMITFCWGVTSTE
ncbi:hypothetical protein Ae706Ps2_6698c [Pseudonocardia sp. Ae706_Ps2]|nr:hypothetical protein Ae706Ps2_6698c [Pseudonocardia sp. Ae706_Ps2]